MHFFRIDPETFEPVSVFDRDLRFLPKVNGAAIPLSEWLPKEDYARFRQWAEEVAAGRQSSRSGTVRSRYSGRQEVFQLTLTPVRAGAEDETRRPEVIGILRDITVETERRKRADENLLLLTTIKESLPYPVFVKEAGDNFRYTMCNPAFSRQMGREVKETVGKTDYELMTVKTDADAIREHDRGRRRIRPAHGFFGAVHRRGRNRLPVSQLQTAHRAGAGPGCCCSASVSM